MGRGDSEGGKAWELLIAPAEIDDRQGPGDAEVWIIPHHTHLVGGPVGGGMHVQEFTARFQHLKAVQATLRDQPGIARRGAQFQGPPLAAGGRALTPIQGDIEHPAAQAAHQLGFRARTCLDMETAQGTDPLRAAHVDLMHGAIAPPRCQVLAAEGIQKTATGIQEGQRNQFHQPLDSRGADLGPSLRHGESGRRAAPACQRPPPVGCSGLGEGDMVRSGESVERPGAGARPVQAPRELLLHTGFDAGLIAELAAEVAANRRELRRWGLCAHPGEALVPAVLRNDWAAWRRLERRRLWKPWRRHEHLWAVAPGLVPSLLQERRFGRLQQQVEERGFRLAIAVHLFDGREQLARDYARSLVALRCTGSMETFAARQLAQHPQRYRLDRLFEPLLEWCGTRGLRFVLHPPARGERLATTWSTLSLFGGAGCRELPASSEDAVTPPPSWRPAGPMVPDISPAAVALARQWLQGADQPPRGPRRRQQLQQLKAQLEGARPQPPGAGSGQPGEQGGYASWADFLDAPPLADEIAAAQQRLGLKVWGMDWPERGPITAADLPLGLSRRRFRKRPRSAAGLRKPAELQAGRGSAALGRSSSRSG